MQVFFIVYLFMKSNPYAFNSMKTCSMIVKIKLSLN